MLRINFGRRGAAYASVLALGASVSWGAHMLVEPVIVR